MFLLHVWSKRNNSEKSMALNSGTRVLFLDDSGKPSVKDNTKAVVIGGFAIRSENVPEFSQRIAEAKIRHFPHLGAPGKWEVKASQMVRPNQMRRRNNREFVGETIRILNHFECTVYSVSIDKREMHHPMALEVTMPFQVRVLAEHFAAECSHHSETGLIISDWSSNRLDALTSRTIAGFVSSRQLPLHPSIYFTDSLSSHAIQVADLVAGTRRRAIEGDAGLRQIDEVLRSICTVAGSDGVFTFAGRPFSNQIALI